MDQYVYMLFKISGFESIPYLYIHMIRRSIKYLFICTYTCGSTPQTNPPRPHTSLPGRVATSLNKVTFSDYHLQCNNWVFFSIVQIPQFWLVRNLLS